LIQEQEKEAKVSQFKIWKLIFNLY
jgi:hypothetical protein